MCINGSKKYFVKNFVSTFWQWEVKVINSCLTFVIYVLLSRSIDTMIKSTWLTWAVTQYETSITAFSLLVLVWVFFYTLMSFIFAENSWPRPGGNVVLWGRPSGHSMEGIKAFFFTRDRKLTESHLYLKYKNLQS